MNTFPSYPDQMVKSIHELFAEPLSVRMLRAADILEEFNLCNPDIYQKDAYWRPSELRREAMHLAEEEKDEE